MVADELLKLLVCPQTRTPVQLADSELLARVNDRIARNELRTHDGRTLTEPLQEALVREDGAVLYPVRDGIPVMLIGESILLEETHET
ncbi:MAG TPA: Trm112 family protein [Candidatus Krumholzibacteria bacterium]|nr:Trm112 family protein [Candidatus Krumholzibacteria bacterium]